MKPFLENVCLRTKVSLRLKKKNKKVFGAISSLLGKFFVSPSKNASHTISIYGNCMISIFSKKPSVFYHQSVLFLKLYVHCMTSIFPPTWYMELYDVNPLQVGCQPETFLKLKCQNKEWPHDPNVEQKIFFFFKSLDLEHYVLAAQQSLTLVTKFCLLSYFLFSLFKFESIKKLGQTRIPGLICHEKLSLTQIYCSGYHSWFSQWSGSNYPWPGLNVDIETLWNAADVRPTVSLIIFLVVCSQLIDCQHQKLPFSWKICLNNL